MEIIQVTNGYIVKNSGLTYVFSTLDKVFDHLLLIYEGLAETFSGDLHGCVTITRPKEDVKKDSDPIPDVLSPYGAFNSGRSIKP